MVSVFTFSYPSREANHTILSQSIILNLGILVRFLCKRFMPELTCVSHD